MTQIKVDTLRNNLSVKLLHFNFIVSFFFLVLEFINSGFSQLFFQQSAAVLAALIFYYFEFKAPDYNRRVYFLLLLAMIHFPLRYYNIGSVSSSALMWHLIIPTFATYFFNSRISLICALIVFMEVTLACFFIKLVSWSPFSIEPLMYEEIKILITWTALLVIFHYIFMKMEQSRFQFQELLKQRYASDAHISRLTSLGEMAGSIAHEVNNPLAVIMGNTYLMEKKLERNHPEALKEVREHIQKNRSVVDQIANITQTMLKISRKDDMELKESTFKEAFSMTLNIVQKKLDYSKVQFHMDEKDLKLKAIHSPNVLSQVLINLISNAVAAVKDSKEKWIKIKFVDTPEKIEIYLQDSGEGIDSKVSARIFEPFYTTKSIGEGTGFGLAISKTIMKQMGGDISYVLLDGHTSFCLQLAKN